MAGITDLSNIFHHIKVKLYPNYLPKAGKGTYIARTDSDKTVNIRDICSIAYFYPAPLFWKNTEQLSIIN